ncbi:hypothetical protein BKA69DRAFT_801903 [Paraphysoderma sedebokerense]|nr:hypothetical protein BKA69DRAFT_801903 [Paraphysoderma sedebokerense]
MDLHLSKNQLDKIPTAIYKLEKLTKLSLSDNKITEIAPDIGKLKGLEWLGLSGNKLDDIEPIYQLKKLKGVTISDNPFKDETREQNRLRYFVLVTRVENPLKSEDYMIETTKRRQTMRMSFAFGPSSEMRKAAKSMAYDKYSSLRKSKESLAKVNEGSKLKSESTDSLAAGSPNEVQSPATEGLKLSPITPVSPLTKILVPSAQSANGKTENARRPDEEKQPSPIGRRGSVQNSLAPNDHMTRDDASSIISDYITRSSTVNSDLKDMGGMGSPRDTKYVGGSDDDEHNFMEELDSSDPILFALPVISDSGNKGQSTTEAKENTEPENDSKKADHTPDNIGSLEALMMKFDSISTTKITLNPLITNNTIDSGRTFLSVDDMALSRSHFSDEDFMGLSDGVASQSLSQSASANLSQKSKSVSNGNLNSNSSVQKLKSSIQGTSTSNDNVSTSNASLSVNEFKRLNAISADLNLSQSTNLKQVQQPTPSPTPSSTTETKQPEDPKKLSREASTEQTHDPMDLKSKLADASSTTASHEDLNTTMQTARHKSKPVFSRWQSDPLFIVEHEKRLSTVLSSATTSPMSSPKPTPKSIPQRSQTVQQNSTQIRPMSKQPSVNGLSGTPRQSMIFINEADRVKKETESKEEQQALIDEAASRSIKSKIQFFKEKSLSSLSDKAGGSLSNLKHSGNAGSKESEKEKLREYVCAKCQKSIRSSNTVSSNGKFFHPGCADQS